MTTAETAKCDRCGAVLPKSELNTEARIHHGARELICIDRKACERRKRKRSKRV